MAYAKVCSEVATTIHGRLLAAKTALLLNDVFFGDQALLPKTPAACVIVGPTETTLVGAPRYVQANFKVQVLVYHCKLQDKQITELECSERAEAVAANLDNAITFNGLVLDGFIVSIEPGFVDKSQGQTWYKTSRITWEGFSKFNLPLEET
jgi:hypothetical protein